VEVSVMMPCFREPGLAGIPESFWPRAAAAGHRLLMVDYDGTLAPFRTNPREAVPLGPSVALLREIARGSSTSLAIVSGRPIREIQGLLGRIPATFVGENGWEEEVPGADIVRHPVPSDHEVALRRAAAAAAAQNWAPRLERKRASLMLHTRGLLPERAREVERDCEELWRELTESGLRLVRVNGGLDLSSPERHKGVAARELLERSPSGTFAVHVGDDVTDEDAFSLVAEGGFGILVGDSLGRSRARGRLGSWLDMPLFLREWLAIVERRVIPAEVNA
jgi:trehalose 6-phosphate phosphatase